MLKYKSTTTVVAQHAGSVELTEPDALTVESFAEQGKDLRFDYDDKEFIMPWHEVALVVTASQYEQAEDPVGFCVESGGDNPEPGDRTVIYDGDAEFEDIDGNIIASLEGAANPCPGDLTPSTLYATIDGTAYELLYEPSEDYYLDGLLAEHVIVEFGITEVLVILLNGEAGTHSLTIECMSGDCIEKGGGPK